MKYVQRTIAYGEGFERQLPQSVLTEGRSGLGEARSLLDALLSTMLADNSVWNIAERTTVEGEVSLQEWMLSEEGNTYEWIIQYIPVDTHEIELMTFEQRRLE